jgi:glyoxylase-like metal-dependent hydrolase (beta-lactamase superfamily II)
MVEMEIMENLWQVGGAEFTSVEDAAIYLVRFSDRAILIDSGCGNEHEMLVENIAEVLPPGVDIEYLFLTHCHYDHTGGAQKIKDQYGCKIVAHELDAEYLENGDSNVTAAAWYDARMIPLKIDYQIKKKTERFQVGNGQVIAHHCPGHSPGSVVYLVKFGPMKVLFGQDVHGPLDASFLSDRDDYRNSLRFMLELDADILCEGHFGIYRGKDKVKKFIGSFLKS